MKNAINSNDLRTFWRKLQVCTFLLWTVTGTTYAQHHLYGTIEDAETGERLAFATIVVQQSNEGILSDSLGRFSLMVPNGKGDTLSVRYIGYRTQVFALNNDATQRFQVKLKPTIGNLAEVVVTADPNPGNTLIKKVIAHRAENDPSLFTRLDARVWARSEVAIVDPLAAADSSGKTATRNGILFSSRTRAFEKVRPKDDTLYGQVPLFFSEKIADFTFTRQPFGENERVLATKTTGLSTDPILEQLARWDAGSVHLYQNRVLLFAKSFVSPIGSDALRFYDFYITDSTELPNHKHAITLQPIPKVWHGNVFTGRITIEDSTYALTSADLRLSKDANINYVTSLTLRQNFGTSLNVESGKMVYVLNESSILLQYAAGLDLIGIPLPPNANNKLLISRMISRFDSVQVNPLKSDKVVKGATVRTRTKDSGASDAIWNQLRPDSLSKHELAIYQMAAQMKSDPRQRIKDKFIATVGTGAYYVGDKLYLGPLGSFLSYNRIEGSRIRVGFRTQEGISKNLECYGHLAYGVGDQRFKGSLGFRYLWNKQPYAKTELYFSHDYNAIAQWYDEIDNDGIINSLFRKQIPYQQTFQHELVLTHDYQAGANWFLKGSMSYRTTTPSFAYSYPNPRFSDVAQTPYEQSMAHAIQSAEASIVVRFAWHERARIYDYQRLPIGSKYPAVSLNFTEGLLGIDTRLPYQKVKLDIYHTTFLTPKAALIWNVEAGKIFGTLPSLLLQVPRGNYTYVVSRYVFNTMRPFEFTADRYLSLQTRLALGGMLFDRIPLLQQLGWRERFTFNAFWGDIRQANRDYNAAQHLVTANGAPFMEAGAGIENIFNLFSIDYIRRMNYRGIPSAQGTLSGLFLGMKVVF